MRTQFDLRTLYGGPEELSFSFTSDDAAIQSVKEVEFLVFRPPVLFVHGYLGGESTWTTLNARLKELKFDSFVGNYSPAWMDSAVEDMAETLKADIKAVLDDYRGSYIKVSRVDVVTHSMGGLITRTFIQNNPDVHVIRKLLMLATPNHGVDDWARGVRYIASFVGRTQMVASHQLNAGNSLFNRLNANETALGHLDPTVEYANLIGRASCGKNCYYPDDAVVTVASAHLNGVRETIYNNTIHTEALKGIPLSDNSFLNYYAETDIGITDLPVVIEKVIELLASRIPAASPDPMWSLVLRSGEGKVSLSKYGADDHEIVPTYPLEISLYTHIRTESDGKGLIIMYYDGKESGRIALKPNSDILFGTSTPEELSAWLREGEARFTRTYNPGERQADISSINLSLGVAETQLPVGKLEGGMAFIHNPQTDFIASADIPIRVTVLEGSVRLDAINREGMLVTAGEIIPQTQDISTVIDADGNLMQQSAPEMRWWEEAFYTQRYSAPSWVDEPPVGVNPGFYLLGGGICLGLAMVLVFVVVLLLARRKPAVQPLPAGAQQKRGPLGISGCAWGILVAGIVVSCLAAVGGLVWMGGSGGVIIQPFP